MPSVLHAHRLCAVGDGRARLAKADDENRLAFDRLDAAAAAPEARLLTALEAAQVEREGQHGAERVFRQHAGGDAGGIGDGQPFRIPGPEVIRAGAADRYPFHGRAFGKGLARITRRAVEADGIDHFRRHALDHLGQRGVAVAGMHREIRMRLLEHGKCCFRCGRYAG